MLKLILFTVLIVFIEVDIFSLCHGLLATYFGESNASWFILSSQVFSTYLGYKLIRSSSLGALQLAVIQFQQGQSKGELLIKKAMMIVGGLLLFLPGLLSDLCGYLCLTNLIQKTVGLKLREYLTKQSFASFSFSRTSSFRENRPPPPNSPKTSDQIIDIEAEDLDKK